MFTRRTVPISIDAPVLRAAVDLPTRAKPAGSCPAHLIKPPKYTTKWRCTAELRSWYTMNVRYFGGSVAEGVDQQFEGIPPLVVQQDGEVILATEVPGARSSAECLRRFTPLEKLPGPFHHSRITRLSLWNAAASGVTI